MESQCRFIGWLDKSIHYKGINSSILIHLNIKWIRVIRRRLLVSLLVIFVCVWKIGRKQKAILKVQIAYLPFALKIEQ